MFFFFSADRKNDSGRRAYKQTDDNDFCLHLVFLLQNCDVFCRRSPMLIILCGKGYVLSGTELLDTLHNNIGKMDVPVHAAYAAHQVFAAHPIGCPAVDYIGINRITAVFHPNWRKVCPAVVWQISIFTFPPSGFGLLSDR